MPSATASGTSTLNVPSAATVVVKVCVTPALSVTVKVIVLPGTAFVKPESVGVASPFIPGSFSEIVGAVTSIVPCASVLAVLPASSVTLALTVNSPSANSAGTSTL